MPRKGVVWCVSCSYGVVKDTFTYIYMPLHSSGFLWTLSLFTVVRCSQWSFIGHHFLIHYSQARCVTDVWAGWLGYPCLLKPKTTGVTSQSGHITWRHCCALVDADSWGCFVGGVLLWLLLRLGKAVFGGDTSRWASVGLLECLQSIYMLPCLLAGTRSNNQESTYPSSSSTPDMGPSMYLPGPLYNHNYKKSFSNLDPF